MTNNMKAKVFGDPLQRQHQTLWPQCRIAVERRANEQVLNRINNTVEDWIIRPVYRRSHIELGHSGWLAWRNFLPR